ncbi:MAG: SDR family NAD(P)-dependent oxidoreductase [Bacteroidetes bacterium]|nr:SDR family NAD(P)-dependent oxidoreductase [Bacteroidota bacterium]
MKLNSKIIVVTGAGSGMGRQLSLQLLRKGARVAMADIRQENLEETRSLAGKDGEKLSLHLVDISKKEQVEQFPSQVIEAHGNVDGIINNAGIIQPFIHVNELDYEKIDRIMQINFYGALYMIKAFLPHLLQRPEAHIANVSSMGGFIPFPGQTIYGASKAAVKLLSEGLYAELKNTNVRVTVIHPGAVNTNISENSGVKLNIPAEGAKIPPMLQPDKAAEIMLDAIEKNKFRVMVGKDARMLDILYRFNPRRAVDLITKKMSGLG